MADQDQDIGNDKPQFQKVKKQWIEQPPILDQRCKEQEQFKVKLQQKQAQLIELQEQLQQQSLMRQRVQQVQPVMPDIQQVPNINFYSTIGALSEFQIGEDWDLYQARLGQYFITNQVSQERKVAVLITLIGQEAYNILKDLCDPALPEAKPYEELCDILKKQFAPRVSVFKERIEFYELRQNEKETVNEWFARIKSKASNCKFGAQLDNNIKDRFVAGLRKGPILNRVCEEEHTVTLNYILEVARKKEMERQDGKDAADQNFDYFFKLLIIGNSSVGKTSFLFRYKDDSFTSDFQPTVGIDFTVKTVFRHDKRIKLQIWDTAGRKRYKTVTKTYYRGAMGFILMYDITNEESFNSVQDWVTQIKYYSCDNAQVILVGNKCDMEEERVISTERGKLYAEQLGVRFFETSAKENINVKAMFEQLVDIICDKMSESVDNESTLMGAGGTDQTKGQRLSDQPTNPANANVMYCNC